MAKFIPGDVRRKRKRPLPYGYRPFDTANARPALARGLTGKQFAVYQYLLDLASIYEYVTVTNERGAWDLQMSVTSWRDCVRVLIEMALVTNCPSAEGGAMARKVTFLPPIPEWGSPEQRAEYARRHHVGIPAPPACVAGGIPTT